MTVIRTRRPLVMARDMTLSTERMVGRGGPERRCISDRANRRVGAPRAGRDGEGIRGSAGNLVPAGSSSRASACPNGRRHAARPPLWWRVTSRTYEIVARTRQLLGRRGAGTPHRAPVGGPPPDPALCQGRGRRRGGARGRERAGRARRRGRAVAGDGGDGLAADAAVATSASRMSARSSALDRGPRFGRRTRGGRCKRRTRRPRIAPPLPFAPAGHAMPAREVGPG